MLKPETKKTKKTRSEGHRRGTASRPAQPNLAQFTREQTAERAYFIWMEKGQPADQDVACWCDAEADLRARCAEIDDEADDA